MDCSLMEEQMSVDQGGSAVIDQLRLAAARGVAAREVPDDLLQKIARQLTELPTADLIRGLDVCTHGICIDYFIEPRDWREAFLRIVEVPIRIRHIDWFPWGIIRDDLIQMRVEYQFDELAVKVLPKLSPQDPTPI